MPRKSSPPEAGSVATSQEPGQAQNVRVVLNAYVMAEGQARESCAGRSRAANAMVTAWHGTVVLCTR